MSARVEGLAIPPAWTDVWICSDERGHLQATGLDAAGRRQYLYHSDWHDRRARRKFELMQELARELPQLRSRVADDLARAQPDRLQVLACAVRLLDRGFMRIGGECYAQENGSYGLATLLREHVTVEGDEISMAFTGKGGVELRHRVRDEPAAQVVREVASYLGNTPAVARASYIDPRLFDRFDDGLTIAGALDPSAIPGGADPVSREAVEPAVLDLLDRDVRSPLVTQGPLAS